MNNMRRCRMRTYSKGFNTKPVVFILVLALVLGLFNAGTLPAIESYAAPTDVINFPDAKLLTALKAAGIDKNSDGVITQGEMAAKTGYLNIDEKGITTLEGIQYATRISYLLFSKNQIKDISPLATMTNLIEITGYSNQISDITPVASLINLTELNFINNQISDLSPVQSVTNLKKLYLEKNQIDDISPLANLKPYTIDLDYNKLDLSPNSPAMQIMNHLIISGCSIKFFPQNTGQTVTTYAGIEKTVFNEYISLEGHLIEGAIVRVYLRYYGEKVFKGTEYEYISPSSGALMKESTIAIGTFPNVDFGGFVGYFMMPASNVTVTAIFEDPLPPTYTAIAQQAIGGTLTVSPSAVALGDWVDIMFQAYTGKRLV